MDGLFELTGRTVVVAGGAGLIGTALSEGLAAQGAAVVVADAARDRGEQVAETVGGRFVETDVTDEGSVESLFETVLAEAGRLDGLVNCSYPRNENYGRRYEDVTYADWRENVDLHLNSYFLLAHRASLVMREQGHGSIVSFGSTYGVQAPDFSVYEGTEMTSPVEYAAIKGGILNLTRYMASYLGRDGVRVNTISPGGVFDEQHPTFVSEYERRTPLDRMARPEDFVGAVVYLLSDAAGYVTGHDLRVDGGWTVC
ncbi:oxidoreductase [Halomarina oriensis]|uniref:SDR family oxidoreductase n=1 Tax=Halomarina oriensis TaxID=671145 RepID=A0A6B0GND7_9EURY|nr:oxidoreductase [Halomarina oriensis]MWG36304.1 SDR family oxidoreductase [Halomarina oriensis]